MPGSVYDIMEVVGASEESWEDAARLAVETASATVKDVRIAEVLKQDITVDNGKVTSYRIRLNISYKHPAVLK